jgi:hypothetical protein
MWSPPYSCFVKNLQAAKQRLAPNRPWTVAEKLLYAHLFDPGAGAVGGGGGYLKLRPGKFQQFLFPALMDAIYIMSNIILIDKINIGFDKHIYTYTYTLMG